MDDKVPDNYTHGATGSNVDNAHTHPYLAQQPQAAQRAPQAVAAAGGTANPQEHYPQVASRGEARVSLSVIPQSSTGPQGQYGAYQSASEDLPGQLYPDPHQSPMPPRYENNAPSQQQRPQATNTPARALVPAHMVQPPQGEPMYAPGMHANNDHSLPYRPSESLLQTNSSGQTWLQRGYDQSPLSSGYLDRDGNRIHTRYDLPARPADSLGPYSNDMRAGPPPAPPPATGGNGNYTLHGPNSGMPNAYSNIGAGQTQLPYNQYEQPPHYPVHQPASTHFDFNQHQHQHSQHGHIPTNTGDPPQQHYHSHQLPRYLDPAHELYLPSQTHGMAPPATRSSHIIPVLEYGDSAPPPPRPTGRKPRPHKPRVYTPRTGPPRSATRALRVSSIKNIEDFPIDKIQDLGPEFKLENLSMTILNYEIVDLRANVVPIKDGRADSEDTDMTDTDIPDAEDPPDLTPLPKTKAVRFASKPAPPSPAPPSNATPAKSALKSRAKPPPAPIDPVLPPPIPRLRSQAHELPVPPYPRIIIQDPLLIADLGIKKDAREVLKSGYTNILPIDTFTLHPFCEPLQIQLRDKPIEGCGVLCSARHTYLHWLDLRRDKGRERDAGRAWLGEEASWVQEKGKEVSLPVGAKRGEGQVVGEMVTTAGMGENTVVLKRWWKQFDVLDEERGVPNSAPVQGPNWAEAKHVAGILGRDDVEGVKEEIVEFWRGLGFEREWDEEYDEEGEGKEGGGSAGKQWVTWMT